MFRDSRAPSQRHASAGSVVLLAGFLFTACAPEPSTQLFPPSSSGVSSRGGAAGTADSASSAGTSSAGTTGDLAAGAGGVAGNGGAGNASAGNGGTTEVAGAAGAQQAGASGGGAAGAQGQAGSAGAAVDCAEQSSVLGGLKSDAQYCETNQDRTNCTGFVLNHCGCKLAVDSPDSKVAKEYEALAQRIAAECSPDCSAAHLCTNPTAAACKKDPTTGLGRCESAD